MANGGTVEGVQAFGGNTLAAWHRYYKDLTGNDIEVHNLFVVPNDFETTLAFSELGSAGLLATDAKETVVAAINEVLRKVDEEASRATGRRPCCAIAWTRWQAGWTRWSRTHRICWTP